MFPEDHPYYASVIGSHADIEAARTEALQWSLARGSRSGRVAWQFARDWAGRRMGDGPSTKAGTRKARRQRA